MEGDALPTSTLSTSKKPKTTHPYSDGSWNGRKEPVLASVAEMTSIGLFRSMWSSNEASSGTTCAYIFTAFRGRREGNAGVGAGNPLPWTWTLGSRSPAAATGSASSGRERDILTRTGILDEAPSMSHSNTGVMIRMWFSRRRPVVITDFGRGPAISRAATREDAPGSRTMVGTVGLQTFTECRVVGVIYRRPHKTRPSFLRCRLRIFRG